MKPIIILLIVFFVVRHFRKRLIARVTPPAGQDADVNASGPSSGAGAGEEMVLDPVCDSYIPLSAAVAADTDHGVEYFCSNECRDKYLAS